MENEYRENFRSFYNELPKRVSSPEAISLEPSSYRSVKVSVDDLELMNSPASVVSSLHQDREAESGFQDHVLPKEEVEQEEDEDEVMSSYVIEINFDHREGTSEAVSIDEAIAWAKEKFQTHSEKDLSMRPHDHEQNVEREGNVLILFDIYSESKKKKNNKIFIPYDTGTTNASELSDQPIDEHGMIRSTKVKVFSEKIKIKDLPWCIMYALLINLINRTGDATNTKNFTTTNMACCDWDVTFTLVHHEHRFNHAPITTSHFNSCENVMFLNLLKYDSPHINIK